MDSKHKKTNSDEENAGWDVLSSYIDDNGSGKEDSSDGESVEVIEREENGDKTDEKSPAISSDEKEAVEEEVVNTENVHTRSIPARPVLSDNNNEFRTPALDFSSQWFLQSVFLTISQSVRSTYFRAAVTALLSIALLLNHTAYVRDQQPSHKLNDYVRGIKSEKAFKDLGFDDVIQDISKARVLGKHYVVNLENMIKSQFNAAYKRPKYKIAPFESPFTLEQISETLDAQAESYFHMLTILNEHFRMSVIESLLSKVPPSDKMSKELQVLLMTNKAILRSEIRGLKLFNPDKKENKTIEEILAEKRKTLSAEERATLYEKYMIERGHPKAEQQDNDSERSYTTYLSKKLDEIEHRMKKSNEVDEIKDSHGDKEKQDKVEERKEAVKPITPTKVPKIYNFGGLFNTTEMIPLCGLSEQLGFDMPDCDTNEPYTIVSSPSTVEVYHFNYEKEDKLAEQRIDIKLVKVVHCMIDSLKENFGALLKKYGLDKGISGMVGGKVGEEELENEVFLSLVNTLNKLFKIQAVKKGKELRGEIDKNSWQNFLESNFPKEYKTAGTMGLKWNFKFKGTNSEEMYRLLIAKGQMSFTVNVEKTRDQLTVTIQRQKKGLKKFTEKLKDGYDKIANKVKNILDF